MISMSQYRRICYLVDKHAAAERFAEFVYPNPQGRRPTLTPRTFLIGCLLTIMVRRTMLYRDVYEVLTRCLPPAAMIELGVAVRVRRGDALVAEIVLTRDHVYTASRKLRKRIGGGKNGHPLLAPDKEDLLEIVNRIIRATLPTRPDGSGAYAVDESGVWTWSKGRGSRTVEDLQSEEDDLPVGRASIDWDATWGVKTSKNGDDEVYFGFSLHGLVRAPALDADRDAEPLLLERLDLTPAGTDLVDPTLKMLDALREEGMKVDELIGDRHYSYKAAPRWAHELALRGIKQVADLCETQHGYGDADNTRVAAGWPHCPETPENLEVIIRPGPAPKVPKSLTGGKPTRSQQARHDKHERFRERIQERQAYALKRHATSGLDSRWTCPALDGKVGCPLRPGTEEAAREHGLPIVENPPAPATAPRVCKQDTVTLRFDDLQPKVHQEHYWGSPEWERSYGRRSYVEGFFGTLKDAAVANMRRDAFRGDCLGLKLLHVGLCCAITNLRLVRKWHRKTGKRLDLDDILLADDNHPTEFPLDDAA